MKTAVSLPDDLFAAAEALSARLGVTRSQLYATALARLLAEHDDARVAAQLDAVYGGPAGEPSGVDPVLARMQADALRAATPEDDERW